MNPAQLSLHTVFMHTRAMIVNIVTFFMTYPSSVLHVTDMS